METMTAVDIPPVMLMLIFATQRIPMSQSHLFIYQCELDLALTYALSRPLVSRDCLIRALFAAQRANRPELAFRANELLSIVGDA